MKLVNAGIKNVGDACQRMYDGEVFISGNATLSYNSREGFICTYFDPTNTRESISDLFITAKAWHMEVSHIWEDDLDDKEIYPNGIICEVTDTEKYKGSVERVTGYRADNANDEDYPYKGRSDWKKAKPCIDGNYKGDIDE